MMPSKGVAHTFYSEISILYFQCIFNIAGYTLRSNNTEKIPQAMKYLLNICHSGTFPSLSFESYLCGAQDTISRLRKLIQQVSVTDGKTMRTIIVTNQPTAPNLQEINYFLNQYANFVIDF